MMLVQVECHAGYRGEETPRRLRFDGRTVELLDCWLAPDQRYVKLRAEDDATYGLHRDQPSGRWELTLYQAPPRQARLSGRSG